MALLVMKVVLKLGILLFQILQILFINTIKWIIFPNKIQMIYLAKEHYSRLGSAPPRTARPRPERIKAVKNRSC